MLRPITAATYLSLCAAFTLWSQEPAPDLILHHAKVVTVDAAFTIAEAMAIRGDRIVRVGSSAEVLALKGPKTETIDLGGKMVLPGLVDCHAHPLAASVVEFDHTLPQMDSVQDVLDYFAARAKVVPEGEWITLRQVFITRLREQRYPSRAELDRAAPRHPVLFATGPDAMFNSLGLQRNGIDRHYIIPDGGPGLVEKNPQTGEPTGLVRTFARFLKIPSTGQQPTPADQQRCLARLFKDYHRVGITGVCERDVYPEQVPIYQALRDSGRAPMRVALSYHVSSEGDLAKIRATIQGVARHPLFTNKDPMLRIIGIKTYLDGGMLTGSAYLRQPWGVSAMYGITDPTYRGVLFIPQERLEAMVTTAVENGLQFTAHSVGDGAVHALLAAYEEVNKQHPVRGVRPCISHSNFMSREAVDQAARLGVMLDIQPAWLYLDTRTLLKQFGYDRLRYFQPLRSIFEAGGVAGGGSDHMQKIGSLRSNNPYNPFLGIATAVTRRARWHEGQLHPEEALSREQAIRFYTINSARILFLDGVTGSLETGKFADFIVLDRDLLTSPEEQLAGTQVLQTYLGGNRVYGATEVKAITAHSTATASASSKASASAAEAEKGAGKFRSLDPAQVKADGEIGRRIDLTINKNLLVIEVENQFLKPFRRKQSRPFDYIGLGKLIDATVSFAYYTRDPKVVELKDHLVKELIATQLADGYLGTFPEGSRIRDIFDEHEIAYNIYALVNNYRRFHDQPSLDAARKLADYILKNYQTAIAARDPKLVCKVNIERAMIALSEATGDARYRDYIVDRENTRRWNSPIDVVNAGQFSSADGHAYTFMNTCLAQLDLCRQQPDKSLLTQSQRVIDYLTQDDGLMITGTCSLAERFRNQQETHGDVGESCATAYLIRLAHTRLQLEGNTLDGDLIERALYNALFAAQSPDGRSLRYYTAIDGPRKYHPTDSYCCPGNWRRIVAELPEMIYYRSADGGVMVNLYTDSTADVPISDNLSVRLRQETDYPNSGKVLLKVEPSRAAEFPVKLRIPRWCESAAVSVNGQPASGSAAPGQWCSIARSWKPGDLVTLDMPMKTRLVRGRKLQAGKVAVMRGPVLFCFSPARQAHRYPFYSGQGPNAVDTQRAVDEAIDKTQIDWVTPSALVPDRTIRPDGQALEVRAWGPTSDRSKPADLTLVLTEFIDPTGLLTYWPVGDSRANCDDELSLLR